MVKSLLLAAIVAGSASAFAPGSSARTITATNAFANGYVGGEGPEPMPFNTAGTSVNFDPAGFAEVRGGALKCHKYGRRCGRFGAGIISGVHMI